MVSKRDDAATAATAPLSDAQVVAYLREHTDFMLRHPDMALTLSPPSRWTDADGVVDMQAFMIDRLKEEIDRIKGATEDLIHTSRFNMSTQSRTHEAVLILLSAPDMTGLARAVTDDLPALLDVDVACLCYEDSDRPLPMLVAPGIQRIPPGTVEAIMGEPDNECALNEAMPGDPALFGAVAGVVESSALVRLAPGVDCPAGLLALGSRQGSTFHPGQGTELITFLGRVVELCAHRFII